MSTWLETDLQTALALLATSTRSTQQLRFLASFLKRAKYFQAFSDALLLRLSETASLRKCSPGEVICKYGEEDKSLFLVLQGTVTVSVPDVEGGPGFCIAKLQAGSSFGELVLARDQPRGSSVTSLSDCALCVLHRHDFEKASQTVSRQEIEEKVCFLRTAPLFEKLSRQGLARLAQYFKQSNFVRGECLYREGDTANSVFLIVDGEVEFVKSHSISEREDVSIDTLIGPRSGSREPLPVRRLLSRKSKVRKNDFKLCVKGAREMLGEEEVISDSLRTSSAFVRSQHATLLVMTKADFVRRMQNPEIWSKIHNLRELKEEWVKGRLEDLNETEVLKEEMYRGESPPKAVITRVKKSSISPTHEHKLEVIDKLDVEEYRTFNTEALDQFQTSKTATSAKGIEFSNTILQRLDVSRPATQSRVRIQKPRIRSSRRHSPPPNFHAMPSAEISSRYREQRSEYCPENRLRSFDAEQLRLQRERQLALEKVKKSLSPSKHNLFRRRSKCELNDSPGRRSFRAWDNKT